jgi:hypothetical protein
MTGLQFVVEQDADTVVVNIVVLQLGISKSLTVKLYVVAPSDLKSNIPPTVTDVP